MTNPAQQLKYFSNVQVVHLIAICAISFVLYRYSEISDLFGGIGSDGLAYSHFSLGLVDHLQNKTYLRDAVGRIFPIAISSIIYDLFYASNDIITSIFIDNYEIKVSKNIVIIYRNINFIYLTISLLLFYKILVKNNVKNLHILFFMTLLFGNFMFLKQFYFEPVFIDQFVFFLSVVFLYSMEYKKKWLQKILLVVSIFTNLVLFFLISILLLSKTEGFLRIRVYKYAIVSSILLLFFYFTAQLLPHTICTESYENKTINGLIYLSISCSTAYLMYTLINVTRSRQYFSINTNIITILIFFLALYLFYLFKETFTVQAEHFLCSNKELQYNVHNQLMNTIRQANSRPFGFLSSHFNYLGLIVVILLLNIRHLQSKDNPYQIILYPFIFLSLGSESRYLTPFLPFIVMSLVKVNLHNLYNNKIIVATLVFFNIIYSGVFKKINPLGTEFLFHNNAMHASASFDFPLQKYFQHLGPWTSNDSYFYQLICFLTMFFLLLLLQDFRFKSTSK